VRPWPDDDTTVQLLTVDQVAPPSAVVHQWLSQLADTGATRVRTGALGPSVRPAYDEAGFVLRQELALLHHDLVGVSARPGRRRDGSRRIRRGRRRDLVGLAHLDRRAFGPTWALDVAGIVDACRATPQHRLLVATEHGTPVGYVVAGRAGTHSYLQRLAVDPAAQGRGVAMALCAQVMSWARRHRCASMLVNTHVDNTAALALYTRLGFVELGYRLAVLERELP
jgi:ribosomal-protein-alanine N-acetyltransferase